MKSILTLAALAAVLMVAAPAPAELLTTSSQAQTAGKATVDSLKLMAGARTQVQAAQLVGNAQTVASVWGLLQQVRSQGLLPVTEADWTEFRSRVNTHDEAVAFLQASLKNKKALTTANFTTLYGSVSASASTGYAANVTTLGALEEVEVVQGETEQSKAFAANLKSGSRLYAPTADKVGELLVLNKATAPVVCSVATVKDCVSVGTQAALEAGARGLLDNPHGETLVRNAYDAFGTRTGEGLKYRMGLLMSAKMAPNLTSSLRACWTGSTAAK